MPPLYKVYLSKLSTTPDNWDTANEADYNHTNGWVKFVCSGVGDGVMINNTHKHLAGHSSYRIVTGKLTQKITLTDCVIEKIGGTEASNYYNAFKEFILRSALTGVATDYGYDLYLWVYAAGGGTNYIKYVDNSEAFQNYCKVAVKGFNFDLTHDGVWMGTLMLEEVWT